MVETANYTFEAIIDTPAKELRFTLQWMRPGEDLMNLVLKALDIREGAFFGLTYKSFDKKETWLRLRPKLADQGIPREKVAHFKFNVRIYPSAVEEFLLQASSRHYVYLACKSIIMNGELDCPADICALLAGLEAQAEFGDYNSIDHSAGFLSSKGPFMPNSAVQKHQLSAQQWETKAFKWWQDHHGLSKIDAEHEYLKVVQRLEAYGVYYFEAMNKTGSSLVCGITFDGLNIYKPDDRTRPYLTFRWNEVNYVKKKNGKLVIKSTSKKDLPVILRLQQSQQLSEILSLAVHHHMYQIKRIDEKLLQEEIGKALKIAEKSRREEEHVYATRNGIIGHPNGVTNGNMTNGGITTNGTNGDVIVVETPVVVPNGNTIIEEIKKEIPEVVKEAPVVEVVEEKPPKVIEEPAPAKVEEVVEVAAVTAAAVEVVPAGPSETEIAALKEVDELKGRLNGKDTSITSLEDRIKALEADLESTRNSLNANQAELQAAKHTIEVKEEEERARANEPPPKPATPPPTSNVSEEEFNQVKADYEKAVTDKNSVKENSKEIFSLAKTLLEDGGTKIDELQALKDQVVELRKDERSIIERLIKSPFSRKIQMEVNDAKYEEKYEAFFNAVDKEVKEFQDVRDMMRDKLAEAEKTVQE